jgi:hypothetical protein
MIAVGIYIKDATTLQYNRIELFSDEKISVNSSIQNVNDISKTFTDYSQTFVIPASKQNNKIFKHWYENSNDSGFSTLVKADAYIELDTIPFRTGKIQLESATIKDNQPDSYSITFIGALGSLKDKFDGLFLKDLTDTSNDFLYSAADVKAKVVTTATSADIMFPLISSLNYWAYGSGYDISTTGEPIRYNQLFPALKLSKVISMIDNDTKWNINFSGSFLTDPRFTNAYLWLKNSETFVPVLSYEPIIYQTQDGFPTSGTYAQYQWQGYDLATGRFTSSAENTNLWFNAVTFRYRATGTGIFDVELWNVTDNFSVKKFTGRVASATTLTLNLLDDYLSKYPNTTFEIRITVTSGTITFTSAFTDVILLWGNVAGGITGAQFLDTTSNQIINQSKLRINKQFPEIKVEDFLTGIMKMFNLTCYSTDGINYTLDTLENYYATGTTRDLTKYIKSDNININRVKSYKKINFEYEKSESVINTGFSQANGIEYGTLFLDTTNEGDEYNIKLSFENLNFNNLSEKLQVGYALKNDAVTKYIPKPVILYDYNPTALTTLTTASDFYFNLNTTGGTSTLHTTYKAFGQEYFDGTNTYSLNFPQQQSTLTNESINNSLYNQYYSNYIGNVFNPKARLIKVSGILPTSLLTSLKLNDKILIRDKKYIINTMTTDLTTGEVQFELLTDFRVAV